MIRYEDIHHIAFVADDLQRGMEEVGEVYGVTWTTPRHIELAVRDSRGDRDHKLSVVYSRQGPLFLEVLQAVPDSIWALTPGSHLHHIGVHVDDVNAEIERLEGLGQAIEAAGVDPDGKLGSWAYLSSPQALRVEIMDVSGREGTAQWARGEIA